MPKGYLLLMLHAHLPYVHHPEYDRFLEERWLYEAVTETYIPLIKFFDRLRGEDVPFRITVSISPTLANMFEDELLRERCGRHLNMMVELAERECERTRDWHDNHFLAEMYRRLFTEARDTYFNRCGTRLAAAFRDFAESGHVELITCAGTHGFLPLLSSTPSSVRAQVLTGVEEHQRIFGFAPKGMWIPECAFYPGLDAILAEAGVRYCVVDGHGIEHADPRPLFGISAPLFTPSGVAVFGRHPTTSKLVWSRSVGYPADPVYREYYRDIGYDLDNGYLDPYRYAAGVRAPTGIKYHRITGATNNKHLYNPDWAADAAYRHAQDFVARCHDQAVRCGSHMPMPCAIVSPYDAELFGHWWFEGPQWLYHVLRLGAGGDGDFGLNTPGGYLAAHPIQHKSMPAASTWGRNGYNEQWVNTTNEDIWRPLHEAGSRMAHAVDNPPTMEDAALVDRVLRQAGRELMLAQSSDWPFMITNGDTQQYARRRLGDHLNRFHYLLDGLARRQIDKKQLAALETMDAVFPNLNYKHFANAKC